MANKVQNVTFTEALERNKGLMMKIIKDTYHGEPKTSWDNVLDGVLEYFTLYANDEASENLVDKFERGEVDILEVASEFEQFLIFGGIEDINEYDK